MRKSWGFVLTGIIAVLLAMLFIIDSVPVLADEASIVDEPASELIEESEGFVDGAEPSILEDESAVATDEVVVMEDDPIVTENGLVETEEEPPVQETGLEAVDEFEEPVEETIECDESEFADVPLGNEPASDEEPLTASVWESATAISVNSRVSVTISRNDSARYYRFTLPAAGAVRIILDTDYIAANKASRLFFQVRHPDNSFASYGSDTFTLNTSQRQYGYSFGLPAGTFYLSVGGQGIYSTCTIRFTVEYTKSNVWERELNNSWENATSIKTNTTYYGLITVDDEDDWYRLTLPTDMRIKFTLWAESYADSRWMYVSIRTASQAGTNSKIWQEQLCQNWMQRNDFPYSGTICTLDLSAGTYYIRLENGLSWGVQNHYLPYHFRISAPPSNTIPIYRMYNTKTSEHMWTKSRTEYESCGWGSYRDWNAEGIAWYAPTKSSTPVYRLYNRKSGDHHYTTSKGERSKLLASGQWRDEGVAFYSDDKKRVPLYRVYNGRLKRGQHHYTASKGERDSLVKNNGWRSEGIGFYGAFKW